MIIRKSKTLFALILFILSLGLSSSCMAKPKESMTSKSASRAAIHTCRINDNVVDILACNIYKEARGEGLVGQLAVGFVTLNRRSHDNFPTSIRGVVYQKKQFSWTNKKKLYKIHDKEAWVTSQQLARFILTVKKLDILYKMLDVSCGSLYYHSYQVSPHWSKDVTPNVVIGNHVFYNSLEK